MPTYMAEHYLPDVDAAAAHAKTASISQALAKAHQGRIIATVLIEVDDTVLHLIESGAADAEDLTVALRGVGAVVDRVTTCSIVAGHLPDLP